MSGYWITRYLAEVIYGHASSEQETLNLSCEPVEGNPGSTAAACPTVIAESGSQAANTPTASQAAVSCSGGPG